jgi:Cof subfamily protein (haloacid dehalogenase superfamily)
VAGTPARGAPALPDPPIRLIALDIDGTIVGDDGVLHERTIRAVSEARRRGVRVSIVTGRMASSGAEFAQRLGLDETIVGYQGAIAREMSDVADGRVGRLLRHRPLDVETAAEIVEWTRSAGLIPHFNHLETLILPADDPRAEDYSRFVGGRLTLVPSLDGWLARRRTVTKVIAVGRAPGPRAAYEDALARFAGRAEPTISHPEFLEFVAPGVSKGEAIMWLARRQGITMAQVMAVGDQINDVEMIVAAGHGVAMGNAPEDVRSVARYVAPDVSEQGAARMIERLVLGEDGGPA